jgi:hypothetical protein
MASKDFLYPDITPQTLKLIEIMRLTYAEHPHYFETSPYPQEVEKYFKSWFQTPVREQGTSLGQTGEELMGEDRYDALYREAVELYVGLKAAKPSNADSSEAMSYFRTITGLMDKLVSHQERALGIKQVHQFHQTVMEIMDNVLTEHQRDDVMKRLKDAIQSN